MIGNLLQERYRIDEKLGHGGMGVVFAGYDLLLDREVAVKVLSSGEIGSSGRARLLNEARAAARLNHPNIVAVYDAGDFEGGSFIVMERLRGVPLNARMPIATGDLIPIAVQICSALEHAHDHGIIHRDLKPENVILGPDGIAKLTDFGLARSPASRLTGEHELLGTIYYMAPEQAMNQNIDGRTDLYALGVMLYELSTGRMPFAADDPLAVISQHLHAPVVPPSSYKPDLPRLLEDLILKLLNKRPEDRPGSAAEVQAALSSLLEGAASVDVLLPAMVDLPALDRLARGRLVGREREMAQVRELWKSAQQGAGSVQVLLISGEPGVGKTPLVRETVALAEVTGGRSLSAECYAEGSSPYAPVAQLVQAAAPLLSEPLPEPVLADLARLAPELLGHRQPTSSGLDPQVEQQRLFESVVALFKALSGSGPLMVVVEDVQWADGATLFLLRHLARRSRMLGPELRLLVVLTYREVELDSAHLLTDVLLDLTREGLATRIKLGRFDREGTRRLLEVMLQEEIQPEFLDEIYRETEGNQFYVEEVCKTLVEENRLVREGSRWRQPSQVADLQIPQSVRLAIESRLSKLSPASQEVLRLAAVLGREFDFETLRAASEQDEYILVEALEEAERKQLIDELPRNGRETFAFGHKLTQATLREGLSGLRRRRMHRRVAESLESLHPEDYEALAYHFGEARDETRARHYWTLAAERAQRVYANAEALRFYSQALAFTPEENAGRFDLLAARVQVYELLARRDEQRADVEALLALAESLEDDSRRLDALLAQTDFYLGTEYRRAVTPAERAITLADKVGDERRHGLALSRLGRASMHCGDFGAAKSHLEHAIQHLQEADQWSETANCLHTLSLLLVHNNQAEAARQAAEEALRISRQAGDRRHEAISLRRLAIALLNLGRYPEAFPHAEQALQLHRDLGDRMAEGQAMGVLGCLYALDHRPEQARELLEGSIVLAEEIGSISGVWDGDMDLIHQVLIPQGHLEDAWKLLSAQMQNPYLVNDRYFVRIAQSMQAELLALFGQYERALGTALTMMGREVHEFGLTPTSLAFLADLYRELGRFDLTRRCLQLGFQYYNPETHGLFYRATLLRAQAGLALQAGDREEKRRAAAEIEDGLEQIGQAQLSREVAELMALATRLHLQLGEVQPALDISERAVRAAEKLPGRPATILFARGLALQAAGQGEAAARSLEQAAAGVRQVAEKTGDPELRRSWLEEVPLNREILAAAGKPVHP